VLGDALERIDDERLERVTITAVDVDAEMQRAVVYYDSFAGPDADAEILAAFADHRVALQGVVGREVRARHTPVLVFRPDDVLRSAARIEQILRENPLPERPEPPPVDEGEPGGAA
jgi:ribosome-binding factor A